jgi:hypothetical protein
LLWLPPIQQKIKDFALNELMKITNNQIVIKNLYFHPFNRLKLEEVYAGDLKGDTLFYAGEVSAGFDLFKLLNNRLLIKSVDLENFVVNIHKEKPESAFNFQFLIDAFASEKPDTASSNLTVQIHDITLRKGRFRYDVFSELASSDSLFDYNHIYISNLQADIDLNSIDIEKPDIAIRQLSFIEKSGLSVTRFQTKLDSEKEKIKLKNLLIRLPHSYFNISEGYLKMSDLKELKIVLGENSIYPADLKMFYSGLVHFQDNLTLGGEINGTLPQLDIPLLEINCGKHIQFKCKGSIRDFNQWKNTPVKLELDRLSADAYGIEEIIHCLSDDNKSVLPVKLGNLDLNGTLRGTLPDLSVHLIARNDDGEVRLDGDGGYDFDSGISRFDATCQSNNFDVAVLLQDTLYGLASLQIQAKGDISSSGNIRAEGSLAIDRFDFNGYSYSHIYADGNCTGDSIRISLNSNDENVKLKVKALADIGTKMPGVKLDMDVEGIFLDPLHFLSGYKNVFLKTSVTTDMKGFDLEKMNLDLSVDNFFLSTDKGIFLEPHFNLVYQTDDNSNKQLNIVSDIVDAYVHGKFTYAGLFESLKETFPMLFPKSKTEPEKKDLFTEDLDFQIGMNNVNSLSNLFELPQSIPDSILFMGRFNNNGESLKLSTSAYTLFTELDTMQLSLSLSNKENNLTAIFNIDNHSASYDLDGSIDAEIEFIPKEGSIVPDMNIALNPTVFVFNETYFNLNPAQIEVREGRYLIRNLLFNHADNANEYVKADGVISASPQDSITVKISQFQLETIFGAIKNNIPLRGEANGTIAARNLLSAPVITSRKFTISDILFADNVLGNLSVSSAWSSERNGLVLRAALSREDHEQSTVSGFILPEKDSLSITANIKDIELKWMQKWMEDALYGINGTANISVKANGKIKDPVINGVACFNNAQVGIKQLNTLYSTSDSIYFNSKAIELKQFTILDKNEHTLKVNGKITHRQFLGFNPDISISISDFLVLNNERQTDNLFYGYLRINGLLKVKKNNKDWLLTGDITHSNNSKVMVNVPSSTNTAERYNSITFINSEEKSLSGTTKEKKNEEKFTFPFKINMSLWLDPSLTAGAVFNLATRDAAQAGGNGMIRFSYDMNTSNINLSGDYTIEKGQATLSLANITKKTFTVQQGGKLVFKGDPLATTFDVTALYNLRADLKTLDQSFESVNLANTKVPVTCSLTAIGNIDKMELKYDIKLPDEQEEIQRKVNGLLYTDDLKIKEIAYLLTFGTFMPVNSNISSGGNNSIWTSLASSSFTSQLNNLLSSVLNENWYINTNLHTGNNGSGSVDMDVNVSTHLFDDRLTINGTLNYRSDPNQLNNFTGDFDMEYKLIPSGNVVLKVFNATNNQYYETAPTTQGLGIVYKRNARTFRKLFDKFRKK